MNDPWLYVGAVCWRSVHPANRASIDRLMQKIPLTYDPHSGDALVERARAQVATRFLMKTDSEVLLHIDSDIIFSAADAIQIAEQAKEFDIVCGIYFTRSADRCFPTSHFLLDKPVRMLSGDPTPVEIQWAATGFLAVHRRVFERLVKRDDMPLCHADWENPLYPFYNVLTGVDDNGNAIMLSEDYALCERARQEGFRVYANPNVELYHLGEYAYCAADMNRPIWPQAALTLTRTKAREYLVDRRGVAESVAIAV